jgi:DmsE family decaheme c-type cytochrome
MKRLLNALVVLTVVGLLGGGAVAWAQAPTGDLVLRGDAQCTKCHNENAFPKVLLIGKTKHGTNADTRTPSCTSCHGASEGHLKNGPGTKPDVVFKAKGGIAAEAQSAACLACHKADPNRSHWPGSTHDSRDITCANCHTVHAAKDRVLSKATQFEVCFNCHKEKRAQVNRPSHHPVLEGKVACSDCHNPHGSVGPSMVKRDNIRDTCFQCHADKRGPFVHNHQPATEACTICHQPHGTVVESMLKVRPPFLCHECHTPHGGFIPQVIGRQASPPTTPFGLGKNTTNVTQGRGCLNCHTEVHGSNNPSATNPTPQFMLR